MGKLHRSPQYDPADKVELNKDEAKAVKEHIEDRLNTRIQEWCGLIRIKRISGKKILGK